VNSSPGTGHRELNLTYVNSTGTAVFVSEHGTWVWTPSTWEAQFQISLYQDQPSAWDDIDGDGLPDRVSMGQIQETGAAGSRRSKVLHRNAGTHLIDPPAWWRDDNVNVTAMALGDVDGDGQPDAAFATSGSRPIELYNNTGGAFSNGRDWRSDENHDVRELQFTDVDLDGDLDLAALRATSGDIAVLVYRNEAGTLDSAPFMEYLVPTSGLGTDARVDIIHGGLMSWADIDYDGQQECAMAYFYSTEDVYEVALLDVFGTNLFESMRYNGLRGPLGFLDVNVDGYPELLASGDDAGPFLFPNQAGTLAGTPTWEAEYMGRTPEDLSIGDFDGDGDPDFALGTRDLGTYYMGHLLYRNDGGTFGPLPDWQSRRYAGSDGPAG
ncbi:MAG: VCBS repeat-containing protein, partial [Verrucomicrobiota bacterium]